MLKFRYALPSLALANIALLYGFGLFYPDTLPSMASPLIFALNVAPILGLSLVLFLASARPLFALLATGLLFDTLLYTSYLKLSHLGQPILLSDLVSMELMSGNAGLLIRYIPSLHHILALASVLVIAVLALVFEKRSFKSRALGLLGAVSLAGGLLYLFDHNGGDSDPYLANLDWKAWAPTTNVRTYGLPFSLIHEFKIMSTPLPMYDQNQLDAVLAQPTNEAQNRNTQGIPVENVVIILSESYFDPADLNGIGRGEFDQPKFTELKQRTLFGRLDVPAFGGSTLRTEYELLTGINLKMFPAHDYPFISLLHRDTQSIVRDFKEQGYSALAVHPNRARFWNRNYAYPFLGFDEFQDIDAFKGKEKSGFYTSDNAFTERLRSQIEDGKKQFVYGVSMENHGPWNGRRKNIDKAEVRAIGLPEQLSGPQRLALQQYIYHRQRAQDSLVSFIESLKSLESRSLVLFFGDHLPSLNPVYDTLDFKDKQSRYQQTTPYLIYDTHRDLSKAALSGNTIDVELLGTVLVDLAGIPLSDFHRHALSLHQDPFAGGKEMAIKRRAALRQLQLWRFWEEPETLR